MGKSISACSPHDSQNDMFSAKPKKENWRIELMKKELDEMRFLRSGADMALIIAERLPAGDLNGCVHPT